MTNRLTLAIAILIPVGAHAADGALEINQACVAAGCFAGDSAGWPVAITQGGLYVLTSNLLITDPNSIAITISAKDVTLNLGGYVIEGPTRCTGSPVQCLPSGSGRGITGVGNPYPSGTEVSNGRVFGFPNYIISLGPAAQVDSISVSDGLFGISAELGSVVERCFVSNTKFGIGVDGAVRNCSVTGTHQAGVQGVSLLESSYITGNTGFGLYLPNPALVSNNKITNNGTYGIIVESVGTNIIGNVIANNATSGFLVTATSRAAISANTVTGNGSGEVQASIQAGGILLQTTPNLCGVDLTCP